MNTDPLFDPQFLHPNPESFGASRRPTNFTPGKLHRIPSKVWSKMVAGSLAAFLFFASVGVALGPDGEFEQSPAKVFRVGHAPHLAESRSDSVLSALGLDDASLDSAWDEALREIDNSGLMHSAEILHRASRTLDSWHASPCSSAEHFHPGTDHA